MDRLVSYYYFIRYGDTFRPDTIRSAQGNNITFDECVASTYADLNAPLKHKDCGPEKLWMQVPLFCGQNERCYDKKYRQWAFATALSNFHNGYLLVGYSERYFEFLKMIEVVLPDFFSGLTTDVENQEDLEKLSVRKTKQKFPPLEETVDILEKTVEYQLEVKFYNIVKEYFDDMYEREFENSSKMVRVNYNKMYDMHGKVLNTPDRWDNNL